MKHSFHPTSVGFSNILIPAGADSAADVAKEISDYLTALGVGVYVDPDYCTRTFVH